MKKLMFIMLCGLLFSVTASAGIDVCKAATKNANIYNNTLPIKIDNATTLINYVVNCELKYIRHEKQMSIDMKKIPKDTLIKVYKDFVIKQCTVGFARYGWNIVEYYYDQNMVVVFVFTAKPENCKKLSTPNI